MPAADAPRDGTLPLAFHPHRIVIHAGVLLALAGLSLSFVSSGAGGRPWTLGDGAVMLGLLAPLVILTVLPDRGRPLSPLHRAIGAVLLLLLLLPYALIKVLEAFTLARALGGSTGPGPWLVLAGVATAAVGVGLSWRQRAEHLPPPPRVTRSVAEAEEHPHPGQDTDGTLDHGEATGEVAWLDENPCGEPLFDSLELEVPPSRTAETVPDDYDEPWPIEDRLDGFQADAQPAPPRPADGGESTVD